MLEKATSHLEQTFFSEAVNKLYASFHKSRWRTPQWHSQTLREGRFACPHGFSFLCDFFRFLPKIGGRGPRVRHCTYLKSEIFLVFGEVDLNFLFTLIVRRVIFAKRNKSLLF